MEASFPQRSSMLPTRYKRARGLDRNGMNSKLWMTCSSRSANLMTSIVGTVSTQRGYGGIIESRTGLSPLTRNVSAFTEYQRLIDDIQTIVHTSANAEPITIDQIEPYLQRFASKVLAQSLLGRPTNGTDTAPCQPRTTIKYGCCSSPHTPNHST